MFLGRLTHKENWLPLQGKTTIFRDGVRMGQLEYVVSVVGLKGGSRKLEYVVSVVRLKRRRGRERETMLNIQHSMGEYQYGK